MTSPGRIRNPLRSVSALAIALLAVGSLAACSAGDAPENGSPDSRESLGIEIPAAGESATIDAIREGGVLRAGVISPGAPPYALQDPISSEWYGPAPDVVTALAQELGVEVDWVASDWDTIVAGLQADKYDIAATALYATEERKEVVDFVNYGKSGACYITRGDDERVQTLEDLNSPDLKVIVVSGSSFVTEFPEKYPEAELTSKALPTGASGFYSEITSGRFDVSPIESVLAKVVAEQQPDLRIVPDVDTCLTDPDLPQDVGLAVRKEDPAFREVLQEVATALEGEIAESVLEFSEPEILSAD